MVLSLVLRSVIYLILFSLVSNLAISSFQFSGSLPSIKYPNFAIFSSGTSSTTVNGVSSLALLIIFPIPLKDAFVASAIGLPKNNIEATATVKDVAATTPIKALVCFFIKLLSKIKQSLWVYLSQIIT